jgi:hypothetical protein
MADRPRLVTPGPIERAQAFRCAAMPLNTGGSPSAAARLVLPPRRIVPASATVKRSLWVFRAPKLELLKN